MGVEEHELTPRELEVLRLACRGLSNRGIASQLRISPRTVGHHLAHVFDKTGLRTRSAVAVWAVFHGVLAEAGESALDDIGHSTDVRRRDRP